MLALRYTSLLLLIILSMQARGQAPSYQIDGIVEDTLGNPLIYATVLLLEKADSTMLDFTRTELDGSFRFKQVPRGDHLVKTTYIGYIPLTQSVKDDGSDKVDMGTMKMKEIASELMEVVIKTARAPMKMRGDTIEYDASTFKVPEGSTVEELLRRLPGIEVDSDGSISADGKDVDKVTVDGKNFFGSDPKAATKNLPAEGISKVQVFDTETEEEKVTGIKGDSDSKTMNLEMKEEFKKGGFGKVIAGVGNEGRRELKGNYNKFDNKIQLSLIGVGNNTGRNGLSWDDYQDFMGSNSWNYGGDGTDYGFGGRSGYVVFGGGGGGNSIEQSIQNLFFNGGEDGFPLNYNGGASFNFDNKKDKLTSVYYYNQSNLDARSTMDQDRFFQAFTQNESRNANRENSSIGHRGELTYERELDSLHSIKIELKGAHIDENEMNLSQINLSRDNIPTSSSTFDNDTDTRGNLLNGLFLIRKKFQKKGRRAGLNVSYLATDLETDWTQNSSIAFNEGEEIPSQFIEQSNLTNADKQVFKANALYVEPLSKKYFIQTFYNYRSTSEGGDRFIADQDGEQLIQNDELSREYDNTITYNRGGVALKYSHSGVNVTIGGAYQHFDLQGEAYAFGRTTLLGDVSSQFDQFIPHVAVSSYNRKTNFSASYTRLAAEPRIVDMQPIVDNINPLYIRTGNPDLVPEVSDSYSVWFSQFWPLQDTRFNVSIRFQDFDNQFSTAESVDDRLVTTTMPLNVDGGNTGSIWTGLNFPIKKNKLKVRLNYSFRLNNRISLVNAAENDTRILSNSPQIKLDFTPSEEFSFYLSGSYDISHTEYEQFSDLDQITRRISGTAELNTKLFAGIFLNSSFRYSRYENDRFDLSQVVPIWDSSIYRFFLPDNQLELRFSLYDALNKNIGINQSAFGISVTQSRTETLARYGMLSVTWNMRGAKTDVRKKSWW